MLMAVSTHSVMTPCSISRLIHGPMDTSTSIQARPSAVVIQGSVDYTTAVQSCHVLVMVQRRRTGVVVPRVLSWRLATRRGSTVQLTAFQLRPSAGSSTDTTTTVHLSLFHRCTRASYVYNGCLAWYNVVLSHGSTQA